MRPATLLRSPLRLALILSALALAAPRQLEAQDDSDVTPMVAARRDTFALRRAPDPASLYGRDNVARLNAALLPYRTRVSDLPARDRMRIADMFEELLPEERMTRYRLNATQAKALVFLALGAPGRSRGDRDMDDDDDDRGRDHDYEADPRRRPPRIEPSARGASVVGVTADHLRATVSKLRQMSHGRLDHDDELDAMNAVVRDAREILIVAEEQRCDAATDAAEGLLTASREAREKVRTTIVSAWMAVGDDKLEALGEMADDVELKLMRCARVR